MTAQPWETAIHESGHAVACHLLGGHIAKVVIYDDVLAHDGMSGQVFFAGAPIHLTPEHRALVSLAGPAAEARFRCRRYAEAGRGDVANAERYLAGTGLKPKDVWPQALRLVDLYKPRIKLVATHLHRSGKLDGGELAQLMRHRLPPWRSPRW